MSRELSLHRNRFGQVAGLIHIQMFADGSIIGNQLQGHCNGKHGEAVFQVRYPKFYISHSILYHRLFLGQKDDIVGGQLAYGIRVHKPPGPLPPGYWKWSWQIHGPELQWL